MRTVDGDELTREADTFISIPFHEITAIGYFFTFSILLIESPFAFTFEGVLIQDFIVFAFGDWLAFAILSIESRLAYTFTILELFIVLAFGFATVSTVATTSGDADALSGTVIVLLV